MKEEITEVAIEDGEMERKKTRIIIGRTAMDRDGLSKILYCQTNVFTLAQFNGAEESEELWYILAALPGI